MRIYFTGAPIAVADYLSLLSGRAVMFSYLARRRRAWADLSRFSGVALDSGAYSVWRRGAAVDIGEYADYCASMSDSVDWYANLDAITDWRASLRNLSALERRGLSPLPVFHLGEPLSLLDDLVSGYDHVGIGRGPGIGFLGMWRLLETIFDRYSDSRGRPLLRFHGFRMTERRLIARFPFDSVDSTTWISGAAYDELPTDSGRARGFSFLSPSLKSRIWLDFFDHCPKAVRFNRARSRMTCLSGAD